MRRGLALLIVFFVAACGSGGASSGKELIGSGMAKTRPDPLTRRTIALLDPETGERFNAAYYHDGRYDGDAMRAIDHLFRDRRTGALAPIDPELIDFLVDIRTRLGLPASVTFEILSGYRTPESNILLAHHNGNVAPESLHTRGWAVDFRIRDVDGRAVAAIAKTMQRGAAVYYPSSKHVHIDIGNIRTWHEK